MIFFFNSFDFWPRKLTLKVRFWHFLTNHYSLQYCLKKIPLSMLILGQKSCILGLTIFKIPQPKWHWYSWDWFISYIFKPSFDVILFWDLHRFTRILGIWRQNCFSFDFLSNARTILSHKLAKPNKIQVNQ